MKKYISSALILCLLSFSLLTGCKKSSPAPQQPSETPTQTQPAETPSAPAEKPAEATKTISTIDDIIKNRTNWNPILQNYYGKQLPDLQLTDINGKTHKLSDYRGKNLMIIFWATWCMPCMEEVPHLNTLRDVMPEDKLAMLAISNENIETVKKTAENKKMKYTVIATQQALPEPFSEVKGIPTAFFVRPDGTLKLVTEGSSYFGEMKSILAAE
jgi:peroxiredoxin